MSRLKMGLAFILLSILTTQSSCEARKVSPFNWEIVLCVIVWDVNGAKDEGHTFEIVVEALSGKGTYDSLDDGSKGNINLKKLPSSDSISLTGATWESTDDTGGGGTLTGNIADGQGSGNWTDENNGLNGYWETVPCP